jgi:hypothetical protein
MNEKTRAIINELLSDPDKLLITEPFYRGAAPDSTGSGDGDILKFNQKVRATLPKLKRFRVSVETFQKERDPNSHNVLYDRSVPVFVIKREQGGYEAFVEQRMPIPFQKLISEKQMLHLCANAMQHTLLNSNPTEQQHSFFVRIKQEWEDRNMEGIKAKMVLKRLQLGTVGVLFYYDSNDKVKARILSYDDGYVICSHKDQNGEHILESVYYQDKDGVEHIDCYDDTYMYSFTNDLETVGNNGQITTSWRKTQTIEHGFNEIPLAVKRADVAWNEVQPVIEAYERLYNIYLVVQSRFGTGLLYIKGRFNENGKKIAGSIVLNDTSMDENADAKFLTPPSPQNMIDTLDFMEQTIQKGSGTTFLLPKDIKISGDTSGVAIQLTQELDMETAKKGIIDWQNMANKMMRLFKYGLSVELLKSGDKEFATAITDFEKVKINSKFVVWRPQSDAEYNQMLATLKNAGGISQRTLIEKNTESTPDEVQRLVEQAKADAIKEAQKLELQAQYSTTPSNNE